MALRSGAVFACIDLVASKIASMKCLPYERVGDGRARWDTSLYTLVRVRPNPRMSASTFWRVMTTNLLGWGDGIAEIQRGPDNWPVALWPIPSKLTQPVLNETTGEIDIAIPSMDKRLPARNVLRFMGFSLDGVTALSPIGVARASAELGYSTDFYGNQFFSRGGLPRLQLKYPGELDDDAAARVKSKLETEYGTLSQSQRIFIAEGGSELATLAINPKDAQFLEVRQYSRADLAALYHVPLRRINGSNGPVGWGNIESENIELLTDALLPIVEQYEQELNWKLLQGSNRYYFEFMYENLLRTDILTRYQAYAIGKSNGWLTDNMILRKENEATYPEGDIHYIQSAMVPAGSTAAGSTGKQAASTAGDSTSGNKALALAPVIADAAQRITRRAQADADREAGKASATPASLAAWRDNYYAGDFRQWASGQLGPVCLAAGLLPVAGARAVDRWCARMQAGDVLLASVQPLLESFITCEILGGEE
jgi:HK97 family phage portal protein